MSEHSSRGDGSMVTTIVVAALVATLVGGFIGGIAGALGYMLARSSDAAAMIDDLDDTTWDDSYGADDRPFEPEVVAWNAPVMAAIGRDEPRRHLYELALPADTVFVEVELEGGGVDLDLRVAFGREDAEAGDWDVVADAPEGSENAWFARMDSPDFCVGPLYVEVLRYHFDEDHFDESTAGGATDDESADGPEPYTLTFRVVTVNVRETLRPGQSYAGHLSAKTGHRADLEVVLPADMDVLRVDIVDVRQNVEIAVDVGPVLDPATAPVLTEEPIGREHAVIDRAELHLPDGDVTLSLTVIDTAFLDREIPFRVLVTAGADAPPEALRIPTPFVGNTPEERVAGSIVGVMAAGDEGSGVVVRADGVILTAAHVVEVIEDDTDDVVILLCDDVRREPIEALRGRVILRDTDRDVAVIQVTGTLHGDPLPDGFTLPALPVRWAAPTRLAEEVAAVGYPVLHDASERSEITWTRGVIAGFESPQGFEMLRFDAEIRGGSSGGALVDAERRLVGITVATHEDAGLFSATGLALPVTEIPQEWLPLLR